MFAPTIWSGVVETQRAVVEIRARAACPTIVLPRIRQRRVGTLLESAPPLGEDAGRMNCKIDLVLRRNELAQALVDGATDRQSSFEGAVLDANCQGASHGPLSCCPRAIARALLLPPSYGSLDLVPASTAAPAPALPIFPIAL